MCERIMFEEKLDPNLAKELAEQINKVINIPFLSERQEQLLLEFLINLILDKLAVLKNTGKV